MKFSTILVLFGFAAFAIAADSTTTSAAPAATLSTLQKCLAACNADDVNCQAACVGVPSPDAAAANATTTCVADCNKNDNTATGIINYTDCVKTCISSNFYTSTQASTPESTTAASGSTATGSAASASGTDTSNSKSTGTGTGTGSSASATSTKASSATNSAPILVTGGSFLGLFAIVAGIFVL